MPSTNKTSKLGLNQWVETDRPMRNDFNADNMLVDSVLGGHVNNADIHVTAEEKKFLKDFQQLYSYVGTGESTKTITLSEGFRCICIFASGKPVMTSDKVYSAVGYAGAGASLGLSLSASGTGFTVRQGADESGVNLCLNENGVQYKAIMFK